MAIMEWITDLKHKGKGHYEGINGQPVRGLLNTTALWSVNQTGDINAR
jgi:hypothetical protein